MKSIGLIFSLVMSVSAGASKHSNGRDYFTHQISPAEVEALSRVQWLGSLAVDPVLDCVDHLRQVACVTDAGMGEGSACDPQRVTDAMMRLFPDLLRSLPPFHQLVLCNINRLQIHTHLFSIGYASDLTDAMGKSVGTMIGLRLDVLLGTNPNHDIWSWKEQLNFGLSQMNDPDYKVSPDGPVIREVIQGPDALLATVMTHELGHLIDFMNGASQQNCVEDKPTKTFHCTIPADSFTALSWGQAVTYKRGDRSPPPEWKAMYPWLSELCYYGCSQPISPVNIPDVYQELRNSNFLTSYSASDAMEDFAEASMIWSLKQVGLPFLYDIHGAGGALLFDFDAQWVAPQNQAKKQWVEAFFSRPSLRYQFPN